MYRTVFSLNFDTNEINTKMSYFFFFFQFKLNIRVINTEIYPIKILKILPQYFEVNIA